MSSPKIVIRANDRGRTDIDWLQSWHTFSFGNYYDPERMGFRTLRVINDDIVAPGRGFDTHPHRDMEIISIVLSGAIEHRDSMGHREILKPGEVQVMTAGKGIAHSEFNPSATEALHLLQIWIKPRSSHLPPAYAQRSFPVSERKNRFCRVAGRVAGGASKDSDNTLLINQDADLYLVNLNHDSLVSQAVATGRGVWIHVATGSADVNGVQLAAGDAAGFESIDSLTLEGRAPESEILVFELD